MDKKNIQIYNKEVIKKEIIVGIMALFVGIGISAKICAILGIYNTTIILINSGIIGFGLLKVFREIYDNFGGIKWK